MFRSNLVIIIAIRLFNIRSYCLCIIIVYFICILLVQFQVVLCFSIYSTIICFDLVTFKVLGRGLWFWLDTSFCSQGSGTWHFDLYESHVWVNVHVCCLLLIVLNLVPVVFLPHWTLVVAFWQSVIAESV